MTVLYTPLDLPALDFDREEFIKWHEEKRHRNRDNINYDKKDFIAPWLVSFAYHVDYICLEVYELLLHYFIGEVLLGKILI